MDLRLRYVLRLLARINQPFKADGVTPNSVLPAVSDAGFPDGPFKDSSNPPLPIQSSILKNLHQCVIAEIAFIPTPIPIGKDTSDWDKLAQRNIASATRFAQGVTTFEIRPTKTGPAAGQAPDQLMIDWPSLPKQLGADLSACAQGRRILAMAKRQYSTHGLTQVDDYTLRCRTGGVTYVPISAGRRGELRRTADGRRAEHGHAGPDVRRCCWASDERLWPPPCPSAAAAPNSGPP